MVRFLDSSVFLHAYLKPKRELNDAEKEIKKKAINILENIERGEEVVTSTVHISEVLNIIEARLGLDAAIRLLEDLLAMENIRIEKVDKKDYEEALVLSSRYKISPNDAIACVISLRMNISEVYSFDKHFDSVPFIKRITNINYVNNKE
ncbi:MAG: PIN domain-containing protein [Thermoproteota archaeon]|jgi:predicted nucleic acid-binding protein|nr:PIN domain-containing protein [Thermoproteota archaeon]